MTIDLGDLDAWKESTAKAASWLTESAITDGEEIPLAVLIETSSNEIRTYGTEAYFEPERLGGARTGGGGYTHLYGNASSIGGIRMCVQVIRFRRMTEERSRKKE